MKLKRAWKMKWKLGFVVVTINQLTSSASTLCIKELVTQVNVRPVKQPSASSTLQPLGGFGELLWRITRVFLQLHFGMGRDD